MVKIIKYQQPKPKFTRPIILLHPNIPKPMHGMNPRTVMGQKWWDIEREKTAKHNNYCCWSCGVHRQDAKYHKWLECHESYKINYAKGIMKLEELVSLCHSCHNYIHNGRMEALVAKGKMPQWKYNRIIEHGNKIVSGIPQSIIPSSYIGYFAEWKEWHLDINGKKFYSKFRNLKEWERFYGG